MRSSVRTFAIGSTFALIVVLGPFALNSPGAGLVFADAAEGGSEAPLSEIDDNDGTSGSGGGGGAMPGPGTGGTQGSGGAMPGPGTGGGMPGPPGTGGGMPGPPGTGGGMPGTGGGMPGPGGAGGAGGGPIPPPMLPGMPSGGLPNQQRNGAPILRYIDVIDGGDNPWKAGCHLSSTVLNCPPNGPGAPTLFEEYGDRCKKDPFDIDPLNRNLLIEAYDTTCHMPNPVDDHTWNCKDECKRLLNPLGQPRFVTGTCMQVPNVCPGSQQNGSAKCVCTDGNNQQHNMDMEPVPPGAFPPNPNPMPPPMPMPPPIL